MKYIVAIGEREQAVEIRRQVSGGYACLVDGRAVEAEIVNVGPGLYSVLWAGESFEARVEPSAAGYRILLRGEELLARVGDPRQLARRASGALVAEGRQKIAAPMPGKVVKILVKEAEKVAAGQGLIVVEAMKMQNEIRSQKEGVVEKIYVAEGASVGVGETLMVVG